MKHVLNFSAIALIWLIGSSSRGLRAARVPPPSGLVSWWRAENSAVDAVGTNNGALQNGAAFAAGQVGLAFSLDGIDDFVTIPHHTNLNPAGPFSVDAWIKANPVQLSPDQQFLIVDKSHGWSDGTGWALQGNPNGTVAFFFGKGGASGDPANFPGVSTLVSVLDNQWHHLAGVFAGSRFEIYLDGALNNTNAFGGTPVNNTRDASLGRSWGGGAPTRHFRGLIDEVSFYNRALTTNEIAALFTAGSAGKCLAPSLTIFRTATNTAVVSWPSPLTGFGLQQNTNGVSSLNWSNVTAIADDGTNKFTIVTPPTGNRFYRLSKP